MTGPGFGEESYFLPDLGSIAAARKFAAYVLGDAPVALDEAVLMVSELATNAVIHARSEFVVRIRIHPAPVRVEVQDLSPSSPTLHDAGFGATSGRGIWLIDRLASSWGVMPLESGKRVWFECGSAGHRVIRGL